MADSKSSYKIMKTSTSSIGALQAPYIPTYVSSLVPARSSCRIWDDAFGQERVFIDADASMQEVEALGLEVLKDELSKIGMKCGGTLQQRAERLWHIRGLCENEVRTMRRSV